MPLEHPGLANLLDAQFGAVTRLQAKRLGIHQMELLRWVDSQGWTHPFPRVYVRPGASGFDTEAMALCLWGGKHAFLSHGAAARLLGLAGTQKAAAEVTVDSGRASLADARIHRGTVPPEDRRVLRGIPHTSAARTLIDLAAVADEETLAIAFEDAWRRQFIQLDWVERRLAELGARGRPGADALGDVLRDARRRGKPLDSALEVQVWRFARKHFPQRLPAPGFEVWAGSHRMVIDFAYPAERLAIEAHSFLIHGQLGAHERDAVRASRLARIGWRVHFATSGQLREPERLARNIREALDFDMTTPVPKKVVHDSFFVPGS